MTQVDTPSAWQKLVASIRHKRGVVMFYQWVTSFKTPRGVKKMVDKAI